MVDDIMGMGRVEGLNYYELPDTLSGWAVLEGEDLWLSMIISKEEGRGNFRRFLDEVEKKYNIIVPTPFARMAEILRKRGYQYMDVQSEEGLINCMVLRR